MTSEADLQARMRFDNDLIELDRKVPQLRPGLGVQKMKGASTYFGIIRSTYLTDKGQRRYVVEIIGYDMQYIASFTELQVIASNEDEDINYAIVYERAIRYLMGRFMHHAEKKHLFNADGVIHKAE